MLRNPLASPDVLGISGGASLAAAWAILVLGVSGAAVSAAVEVEADSPEEVERKLYEKYEHIGPNAGSALPNDGALKIREK